MPKPLTQHQKEVFEFVKRYIELNDYAPTLREIREATTVSNIGLVHKNLSALDKKGYLNKEKNTNRGVNLTPVGEDIKQSDIPMKKIDNQNQEKLFEDVS